MKKTTQTNLYLIPRLTTYLLAILFLSTVNPAFAADDGYLDALSEEAESSAHVRGAEKHDEAYYDNQKKMVEMLKLERPSTYKFYTKLTPKNKTRVFEKYMTDDSDLDNRLSHLQKHIMDMYFKK